MISDSASGLAARARLDLMIRERLAEACERSIEGLMGADTAVYVVRQVRVSLTVNARAVWEETALARKWGKLVGEAAVRVAGKNVGVKADGQRKHTGQMADDFNGNHQRRQNRHGPGKVLQVANPCMFEALRLVVDKGATRIPEALRGSRRRLESRNHPDQVADTK